MELLLLIGGTLYVAAIGFFVMDRLGRFLDEGGISPDWDGTGEAQGAGQDPDPPRQPDFSLPQDSRGAFHKK